jgi:hypothetical protein
MPTSLQYPLERQRDVQRRWKHLLHRTVQPKDYHLRLHLNGLLQRQQETPDQRGKPHVPPFTATRAAQLALGWTALATIAAETKGQKGIRSL